MFVPYKRTCVTKFTKHILLLRVGPPALYKVQCCLSLYKHTCVTKFTKHILPLRVGPPALYTVQFIGNPTHTQMTEKLRVFRTGTLVKIFQSKYLRF